MGAQLFVVEEFAYAHTLVATQLEDRPRGRGGGCRFLPRAFEHTAAAVERGAQVLHDLLHIQIVGQASTVVMNLPRRGCKWM